MSRIILNNDDKAVYSQLKSFYQGKKVLITGHTGFKGSWLCCILNYFGANVIGYALDPKNENDNFVKCGLKDSIIDIRSDIRNRGKIANVFIDYEPEIIFHLAAQPLVIEAYNNPIETYEVNIIGTANVLEEVRKCDKASTCIVITTDKCYKNKEQIWGYREIDELGGHDPYSASKACSEILTESYRNSFMNPMDYEKHGKSIATARAGNVIGGGDWSENRIIPDCIRALEEDRAIEIRNPYAQRPWQLVLEPLFGYLLLGYKMSISPLEYSEAWNFGPSPDNVLDVWEIAQKLVGRWGAGELIKSEKMMNIRETNILTLDSTKSKRRLGWKPKLEIDSTLDFTVEWYKNYNNLNMKTFCYSQIEKYIAL